MTKPIRAFAAAKVNLDLRVLGRRPDGYHELDSLVAFADVGDRLIVEPSGEFALTVDGPAASQIDGSNLISSAAKQLVAKVPGLNPGRVRLCKELPVEAGLGGGSADVAAYLRAMRSLNSDIVDDLDWDAFALSLGADVPVCLAGQASWMRGIGEIVEPVGEGLPPLPAVLVNPGVPVSTPEVFRALAAPALSSGADASRANVAPTELNAFIAWLAESRNDLEVAALRVAPEIAIVRRALEDTDDVRLVRMSGSGATFFGVYGTTETAKIAWNAIRGQHPNWWVEAVTLGGAL